MSETQCVNTMLLEKHEQEVEKAEKAFDNFNNEVEKELLQSWEDLESQFNEIASNYNVEMTFIEWLREL